MLINFNNGQPPAEVKDTVEAQIKQKFGGSSNAGRFIISWNDGKESAADITPVQLSDAHNQYQFLSQESMQKIMVAHRIVSPLLLGIKDNTGFGSNADELKSASILFDNVVVRPFQRLIIDAVTKVLNFNGFNLNLYFKTLQPLEFTDLSGNVIDDETREEETGVSLASQKKKIDLAESYTDYPEGAKSNAKKALDWAEKNGWGECGTPVGKARANQLANGEPISRETIARMAAFRRHQQNKDVPYSEGCGGLMWDAWGGDAGIRWAESKLKEIDLSKDMTIADEKSWIEHLKGKGEINNDEEWELIDVREVEDADEEMKFNLAYDNPNKKSDDDKGVYKIRYRYGPDFVSNKSREFCSTMVQEAKSGVIFRREDIIQMGDAGVNGQFAPSGQSSYSIWKYKGGVNCHHRWERLTFRRKQVKGKFLPKQPNEVGESRDLDNYNEVSNKSADAAGVPFSPSGWNTAKTRPIDMPNKGSLKNK
jgi:hypothetical protein